MLRAACVQGHLSGIVIGFAIGGGVFRWFDNYLALCTLIWSDAAPIARAHGHTHPRAPLPLLCCVDSTCAPKTCEHAAYSTIRCVDPDAVACVCVRGVCHCDRVLIGALVSLKLSGPFELSFIQVADPQDIEAPRADINIVNGSATRGAGWRQIADEQGGLRWARRRRWHADRVRRAVRLQRLTLTALLLLDRSSATAVARCSAIVYNNPPAAEESL